MVTTYGLITIGPVQSLISQARRTQDLWVGSQLLQLLVKEGIKGAQSAGARIITPNLDTIKVGGSIPNRFVFQCISEEPNKIVASAYDAVISEWNTYAKRTFEYFTKKLQIPINTHIWDRQIDPEYWLEFYSATIEADDGTHFGKVIFSGLMQQITLQKMVRSLPQPPEGEPGYKCSITGEHEAIHDKTSGDIHVRDLNNYWARIRTIQGNRALLSEGERLSAFSIIKRFGHEANPDLIIERFPSTSSIASSHTRYQLLQNWEAARMFVNNYIQSLEKLYNLYESNPFFSQPEILPYYLSVLPKGWSQDNVLTRFLRLDGDFLYLDMLQPRPLATHIGNIHHRGIDQPQIEFVRSSLKSLYKAVESFGITEPSSYYAILSMDGDRMGEAVEGFELSHDYSAFSLKLSDFATNIIDSEVETKAGGRVVYTGGDDLLALMPLSHVFKAANIIRQEFPRIADYKSISGGIAIVHRSYGLQSAVHAAKRAEHSAKEQYRTNVSGAFAFEILRRSGEPQAGGGVWERKGISILDTLATLCEAMIAKNISHGFASDLPNLVYSLVCNNDRELARQLERDDKLTLRYKHVEVPSELRKVVFKQLYERRCTEEFKKDTTRSSNLLYELGELGEVDIDGRGWFDVMALAYLARFLSQEG